jgi:hypothetical protein
LRQDPCRFRRDRDRVGAALGDPLGKHPPLVRGGESGLSNWRNIDRRSVPESAIETLVANAEVPLDGRTPIEFRFPPVQDNAALPRGRLDRRQAQRAGLGRLNIIGSATKPRRPQGDAA